MPSCSNSTAVMYDGGYMNEGNKKPLACFQAIPTPLKNARIVKMPHTMLQVLQVLHKGIQVACGIKLPHLQLDVVQVIKSGHARRIKRCMCIVQQLAAFCQLPACRPLTWQCVALMPPRFVMQHHPSCGTHAQL